MEKLSSVCTCGHRLREHRADIETCEICECEKFTVEAALEKLRAIFNGPHMADDFETLSRDYQHDAVLYVTALEHRLVQVTAVAQINIEAGRECKAELNKATAELDMMYKALADDQSFHKLNERAKMVEWERDDLSKTLIRAARNCAPHAGIPTMPTKIPWVKNPDGSAGETWNPVRGCSPISPGCENCYASRMATRFSAPGGAYAGLAKNGKWTGEINVYSDLFDRPLRWRKPRTIFVNSMSDLFHEKISFEVLAPIFATIRNTQQHRYIILTKRPTRMKAFFDWYNGAIPSKQKMPRDFRNVWTGVSAENQKMYNERVDNSLFFVSVEPMLDAIDLHLEAYPNIRWIICGAESGHGARPFESGWAEYLRDQCIGAGVPFFLKQARDRNGNIIEMPAIDGKVWDQIPEVK